MNTEQKGLQLLDSIGECNQGIIELHFRRWHLSCSILRMSKKVAKPCSRMRWALSKFCYALFRQNCNELFVDLQNGENMNIGYDYQQCIGLKVKPRKGDGLLFYSLMVNGTIDPVRSWHSNPHGFSYSTTDFYSK